MVAGVILPGGRGAHPDPSSPSQKTSGRRSLYVNTSRGDQLSIQRPVTDSCQLSHPADHAHTRNDVIVDSDQPLKGARVFFARIHEYTQNKDGYVALVGL